MTAATAALRPPGSRRRFVAHQAIAASCAIVAAHVVLAVATVIATGQLPVWGRYFAFLHALLLGGKEGSITYGFDHFSPAIAVGGACVVSAAAIVLLIVRAPAVARRARLLTVTIAGTTAYSIALYSYADNRSSTYLLLYIALPLILTAALWLGLATTLRDTLPASIARGTLALGLSVAVILIAAAWGAIGGHFSRSALAHAYPGGGLRAAIHRLWHPPPIDPRAPDGERLLARYMPQSHPVMILPDAQDLAIEILMRSHRSNGLFIGDGYMDSFVPSEWEPVVARQIARLRPGQRVLVDRTALALVPVLRADRSLDPVAHRIGSGAGQEEWILQRLSRRFVLRPVAQNEAGLVVAQLEPISS